MSDDRFEVGDRVDWSDELDLERRKQLVEDFGPGPFEIYKTEIRDSKQFVVLSCRTKKEVLVLEDRDQLLFPINDPAVAKIPARISAFLLKKV
ncbi:MAG: hypothetical protein Q7S83_00370 [bacterium]|nr:hypothetical protein [bacterium]